MIDFYQDAIMKFGILCYLTVLNIFEQEERYEQCAFMHKAIENMNSLFEKEKLPTKLTSENIEEIKESICQSVITFEKLGFMKLLFNSLGVKERKIHGKNIIKRQQTYMVGECYKYLTENLNSKKFIENEC